MTLPDPTWTDAAFDAWRRAVPADLVTPPGPAEGWTCLFSALGPRVLALRDNHGHLRVCDASLVRALARGLGHPCRDEDQLMLLLVTPIPKPVDLQPALRAALRHDSYNVRLQATLTAAHLGEHALLPDLRGRLGDSDNDVRRSAAEALGRLGDAGSVPALLGALGDDDSSVDLAIIEALASLNAEEALAVAAEEERGSEPAQRALSAWLSARSGDTTALAEALSDDDDAVVRTLASLLATQPTLAESLIGPLRDAMAETNNEAAGFALARALACAGEESLDVITDHLESSNWTVRMRAVTIATYSADATPIAAALMARLSDDDYDVRREAALACATHGLAPGRCQSILWSTVNENYGFAKRLAYAADRGVDLGGAGALVGVGSAPVTAISFSQSYTASEWMRCALLLLIGLAADPVALPSLHAIAGAFSSQAHVELRRAAVAALLLAGEPPADGVAARLLLFHDQHGDVSLGGPTSALAQHAGKLAALASRDPHWHVRLEAIKTLNALGPAAQPYQDLIDAIALFDDDNDCRKAATRGSNRAWQSSSVGALLPTVLGLSRNVDDDARRDALQQIAQHAPGLARPIALSAVSSDDRQLARAAAAVLGPLLSPAEAEIHARAALGRLTDTNWIVREVAADLLASLDIGALSADLRDELRDALTERIEEDSDNEVQNAAKAARARLDGAA